MAIQMAFVNAWSRNGFNQLVGPPTSNVTSYGATGLIQQFPSITTSKVTLALIKPDTTSTFNVLQMQAAMFAYYGTVGVGTAGYPLEDTMTCPPLASVANSSCQWQLFTNNYALFAYAVVLPSGSQNFATRDPFFTKWMSLGGLAGLGPTTSAETAVTSQFNTKATVQTFDGGAIVNITSGLLSGRLLTVSGPVYAVYLAASAETGTLGLPVTTELVQPDGTLLQTFEGGAIQHDPKSGSVSVLPAIASIALTPSAPAHLNLGDTLIVQASVYASTGGPLTGRAVSWNTSNGRVVTIQATGQKATLMAVGSGTANITVTAEGKVSPPLLVTVSAPCCQIGEGAPSTAVQQAIQAAVARNSLNVQLPAASAVTRAGSGYVQQLLSAGANPVTYLVAVADGAAAAYVVSGPILAQYLMLGGPSGSLGYPSSDVTAGGRQAFLDGNLAGNPVQLVTGAILAKWGTLGYETGAAGSPTGAQTTFLAFRGTAGMMQPFQNALILAATSGPLAGQTYAVGAVVLAQYNASGGPGGDLGAPTGDEQTVNGLRQQNFEGGSISYAPGSSSATVTINPRQPLVTATPPAVLSGTVVHLLAGGFNNGATIRVSQTGQPDFVVSVANGAYSWDLLIPAAAANGVVTVRAADTTSGASAQATYTVTNIASAGVKVAVAGGDHQTGAPGSQLSQPLVVSVEDQAGNPVPGQVVTFTASPGAQITPFSAVTDANGQASAMLRLPPQEGIALATAEAVHRVVTFSARSAAFALTNFPALTQNVTGKLGHGNDTIQQKGALLTAVAAILRYHQLRNELPQPNGLADPVTLNQFLTASGGFVSLGQSSEQTVNLWRVAGFVGNHVDVRIESGELDHVRDLVAAGSPVLLALTLAGLGSHFVVATGIGADGSITIADPNPAFSQTNLNQYLSGFTAHEQTVKAGIAGAIQLVPQAPPAPGPGFLVFGTGPIIISSVAGQCGLSLQFPDTASVAGVTPVSQPGSIFFSPCSAFQSTYEVDITVNVTQAVQAQFTDLSPNGASAAFNGTNHLSFAVVRSGSVWTTAPVSLSITPPGVVNGASYTAQVAPGSFVSIFGTGLASAVQINGEPLTVVAAIPFQINAQIPFDIEPGPATVTVTDALGTAQQAITISPAAPAIFSISPTQAAITNQDNTLNMPSNPAPRGGWLVIYATGLGPVSVSGDLRPANTPVSVVIGGVELPATYAGLSPGLRYGVDQVNVQLALTLPPGQALPLYLKQGEATSNTVTVAIQ
jgi:uncharacterized protein (TIGR03437 family)